MDRGVISGRLGAEQDGRDEWRRAQVSFKHTHSPSHKGDRRVDHEFAIGFRVFRVRKIAGTDSRYVHPRCRDEAERRGLEELLEAAMENIVMLPEPLHMTYWYADASIAM